MNEVAVNFTGKTLQEKMMDTYNSEEFRTGISKYLNKTNKQLVEYVINTPSDLYDLRNKLLDNYRFKNLQKIIANNSKSLIPLMYVLFEKADCKSLSDKNFKHNYNEFFNFNNVEYKCLLRNSDLCTLFNKYKTKNEKIMQKNPDEEHNFLIMVAKNGYSEDFKLVKDLFTSNFKTYNEVVETQMGEIKRLEEQIESIVTAQFTGEFLSKFQNGIIETLNVQRESSKNIAQVLNDFVNKNNDLKSYKDINKIVRETASKISRVRKEENSHRKLQMQARNSFINREQYYFEYFDTIIRKQVFYESFPLDDLENTFIDMCDKLWNILDKYPEEKDVYNSIKNNLDSIIPALLEESTRIAQNAACNPKTFYSQYCRLDSIYQRLYKYTSKEDTKIKILEMYANNDTAPIPFEIISDALDIGKFSNLAPEARAIVIPCIEKRYKKLIEGEGEVHGKDSLTFRLYQINRMAICNTELAYDVRNKAFRWYFDYENDKEKKFTFCWELIEVLDELDPSLRTPLDNNIYGDCRRFLICYESDVNLRNKLLALMQSPKSTGLISDFVYGFAQFGGNDASFGMIMGEYGKQKKTTDIMIRWNKSEWDERNALVWKKK